MMSIISMVSITMTIVAISRLGRSLAIMISIISTLSNSSGFGIGSRLGISYSISLGLSISRPLAIVMSIIAMVSIAVTIAMTIVAIARFSCSNAQNSEGDGNQKIHCCAFLKL